MNSITIETMTVTPDMAAGWLKNNTQNRSLSNRRVEELARDIRNGMFQFNGEAIKLAEDGLVLDGQHRLEAIVRAGEPIVTLVVQGLPAHTQDTMDTGRARTAADALKIHGVSYASNLAAVSRRVWQWDRKNYKFTGALNPTLTEILEVTEQYPSLARSVELAHRISLNFRVSNCTANGLAHHIFLALDADLTASFFARLENGADLAPGHPVLALRDRLVNDKTMQRKVPLHQNLSYYIRAWNALREDRTLGKIQHTAAEAVPMPK